MPKIPKLSIVPEMLNFKGIRFFDERDIEVVLCNKSDNLLTPFNKPYLTIDTFAVKTTKPPEIVPIGDTPELKKLGYVIAVLSVSSKEGNYRHQKKIYILEKFTERNPGRRITYIPTNYRLQKDIANKKVRIVGPSAGYPYFRCEYGNCGPWREYAES